MSLDFGAIRRTLMRQSPAMWFIMLYVFFEYVRPQSVYKFLDVAPWSLISLVLAVLLTISEGRIKLSSVPMWMLLGMFSLVIVASSITAYYPAASWAEKDFWINWVLLILIVGAGLRTRTEFFLFLLSYFLWNLKMSQHGVQGWVESGFGFRTWGATGGPGWFQNSGEFGIQMCVFLPLVAYFTHGLWPQLGKKARIFAVAVTASGLISIIASSSRGAMLGIAGVAIWVLLRSPNRLRTTLIVVSVSWLTWTVLPAGSKARFEEMGTDETSTSRLDYWEHGIKIANEHPLLGIGYKNWLPYYRDNYNAEGELPHNFLVECVAELGYTGLIVLLLLILTFFVENARTRRHTRPGAPGENRLFHSLTYGLDGAMIGFIGSGMFVTVLFYPFIWMNLALCLALVRVARLEPRSQAGRPRARFPLRRQQRPVQVAIAE